MLFLFLLPLSLPLLQIFSPFFVVISFSPLPPFPFVQRTCVFGLWVPA